MAEIHPTSRLRAWNRTRALQTAVAAALLLSTVAPTALRAGSDGPCMLEQYQDLGGAGGLNCTAQDFKFQLLGFGLLEDGCTGPGDTMDVRLGITLQSGPTREDVGIFIKNDPGGGDSQTANTCYRQILEDIWCPDPNSPAGCAANTANATFQATHCVFESNGTVSGGLDTVDLSTVAPSDATIGDGYFFNVERGVDFQPGPGTAYDTCGELLGSNQSGAGCDYTPGDADTNPDNNFILLPDTLTLPCADLVGDPDQDGDNDGPDGFADIDACASFANNANQFDCQSENDMAPGTSSKCRCTEGLGSNIPQPDLRLSCGCKVDDINPFVYTCSVGYDNPVTCTDPDPAPALPQRQCGAASFFTFVNDYSSYFTLSNFQLSHLAPNPFGACPAGWCQNNTPGTDQLTINPYSSLGGLGNATPLYANIISPGDSAIIDYTVTVDPLTPVGTPLTNTWTAWWGNASGSQSREQSHLAVDCSFEFGATWSLVNDVHAYRERGRTVVGWRTGAESGTLGFDVYRVDSGGRETKVNRELVPSVRRSAGGEYRVVDAGAPAQGALRYRIVEIEMGGAERSAGPFEVEIAPHDRKDRAELPRGRTYDARLKPQREPQPSRQAVAEAARLRAPSGKAKLLVTGRALHSTTAAELATAMGLPEADLRTAISARNLRLTSGGGTMAWEPLGSDDGIRFFGVGAASPTASHNVYWVELGAGLEMVSSPARAKTSKATTTFTEQIHFESNLEPRPEITIQPESDWWIWKAVNPAFPAFKTATFTLNAPDVASSAGASLSIELVGYPASAGSGSFGASVKLNGTLLGQTTWRTLLRKSATFAVPAGLLVSGNNTVVVTGLGGTAMIDSFDLRYVRSLRALGDTLEFRPSAATTTVRNFTSASIDVLDITSASAPRRITSTSIAPAAGGTYQVTFRSTPGRRYLAVAPGGYESPVVVADEASDLHAPTNGADYLVLTDQRLRDGAQDLADYRAANGLAAMVVDVEDIFDEWSHGLTEPEAIRSFLEHAATSWQTPPTYVALAGRGTFDPRDIYGVGDNFVPALQAGSLGGLAISDTALADFDGDGVPELAIGRIPATTNAELSDFVDKIAAYETALQSAGPGSWATKAILVADDPDAQAGDFPADSSALGTDIAAEGLTLQSIAMATPADAAARRAELLAALSAGAYLWNYVGHGGFDLLADEGLFTSDDVPGLANSPELPVLTTATCYVGLMENPGLTSLGEQVVLTPDGGALAAWVPGSLSLNEPAVDQGGGLTSRLAESSAARLGDRVREAIASYLSAGGDRSNAACYNLFGDPATSLR